MLHLSSYNSKTRYYALGWRNLVMMVEGIAGNHDIKNLRQNYTKYFEQITMQMHIEVDKQKIYLNHCPFLCYGGAYCGTW